MAGRLKQPGLVTSGSPHQPPSLTRSMDGRLCAEREHHTERAREKDGKSDIDKEREIGKQKKGERKYPREGA